MQHTLNVMLTAKMHDSKMLMPVNTASIDCSIHQNPSGSAAWKTNSGGCAMASLNATALAKESRAACSYTAESAATFAPGENTAAEPDMLFGK